jgi:hypothetical protein
MTMVLPETRFTRCDGVDIAYQVIGDDRQRDIVYIPAFVSHLEVMWELAEFAPLSFSGWRALAG